MSAQNFLNEYHKNAAERAKLGIPPLALTADETKALCLLLADPSNADNKELLELLEERVLPGVDDASAVKAEFLNDIVKGKIICALISPADAVNLLGKMKGGFNVDHLIALLDDDKLADAAVSALSDTIMVYDAFNKVKELAQKGVKGAKTLMNNWANATWFTEKQGLPEKITLTVFKVSGEATTDDFSPATDAWSRPDIPLHALAMFKNSRPGLTPDEEGVRGPVKLINELKQKGFPLVYVGDVVGTGSSRKSAANSLIWYIGNEIPGTPNKKAGGFVLGGKIAPIFYNTLEDSGALPIECDVSALNMGDVIDLYPYAGKVCAHDSDKVLSSFKLKTQNLLDEVKAGGRIPLIIGRSLTDKARAALGLPKSEVFIPNPKAPESAKGYTRAQKIVGKACGVYGVRPGEYCEPKITTVGSQDTTGPMTRDELKDLSCLKFSADLVMQSFCHTAAYPKPVDIKMQKSLPGFMEQRGGIALRPGDGVIHSWLNRMALPDTVGTGGDSHTRMPIGISFAAGSGLVAFAAAAGMMPLDMPESVLVRFVGKRRPGITLRDLVHAIPYFAIKKGLLTVDKKGKKNIFSGKILEIEGLEDLSCEHAFELADASAERSAAACAIALSKESVCAYLRSNAALLRQMANDGYESKEALLRRADAMEAWVKDPELIYADPDCEYAAVLEIDMGEIIEPIVCVPNDPDDVHLLSEYTNTKIDEVFIGSCMTNIGHFRAAGEIFKSCTGEVNSRLWMTPPTRMDRDELRDEGLYAVFAKAGARMEIPGCSLCMGNQARVRDNATVVSTSTRNFPNRLGKGANVFLASAELAAVCAKLGRMPSVDEYFEELKILNGKESEVYTLLDFAD